ncbi:MAG: phosphomannomutase/phosphoglucomutase [Patescibacteria group bacterium]|nr:phosphomannomutase/phosphoglucomutase [Patescibacteria group bacterium]
MNKELFSVFKAYDIRGESPQTIDTAFSANLGQALVKAHHPKRVMVARDMRLTSPELEAALVESLSSQGVDVVKVGLCSTPMFNALLGLADPKFDLGVMITASHNPSKYNGYKLTWGNCMPIGLNSGLSEIRDAWPETNNPPFDKGGRGDQGLVSEDPTALDRYLDHVIKLAELPPVMPEMKIVIDAGNGMAGYVIPKLLEKCPWLKAEKMYFELDGNFPNHEANPLKEETLAALKKRIQETGAVCGVAFDGDADRVGFLDEKAELIKGDIMTALLSTLELPKKPGAEVLFDIRSSWAVPKIVSRFGGKPRIFKVGHALIKKEMKETGAWFAGEVSMHYYFGELWNLESGDYAMLLTLKMLALGNEPLGAMRQKIDHYFHSGEINFEVKDTKSVLERVKAQHAAQATKVIEIDGIRCEFGDPQKDKEAWWFNVRGSNTEPLVRLNLEATSKELMEQKVNELTQLISQAVTA